MKNICINFSFCIIALMITLFLVSCYSENDLRQRYNKGFADGRSRGYTDGYNTAKTEYEKQINELQNRLAAMERSHRNSITAIENNNRNRINTMEIDHRTALTAEYNRGFQAGADSMMERILTQVDLDTQQRIRRNRRNEALFTIR